MDDPSFWPSILSTFFATIAGAGVGAFATWLIFRVESRGKYELRLTESLAQAMEQLSLHITLLRGSNSLLGSQIRALDTALNVARMLANTKDQEILNNIESIVQVSKRTSHRMHADFLESLTSFITDWRSHQLKHAKYLEQSHRMVTQSIAQADSEVH